MRYWRHTDMFGYYVLTPLLLEGEGGPLNSGDKIYYLTAIVDSYLFLHAALQGGP